MSREILPIIIAMICLHPLQAQVAGSAPPPAPTVPGSEAGKAMSDAYWALWNPEVQANALIGQYHRVDTRAQAMAVHQSALYFGIVVSS